MVGYTQVNVLPVIFLLLYGRVHSGKRATCNISVNYMVEYTQVNVLPVIFLLIIW